MRNRDLKFSDLVGQTIESIETINDDEQLIFDMITGHKYRMCHHQDCCESVSIEDICGDLEDIIGSPVIKAEEVSSSNIYDGGTAHLSDREKEIYLEQMLDGTLNKPRDEWDDSNTWTFYKIDTIKGGVTIRWHGTSNGYYSESVDFEDMTNESDLEKKDGKYQQYIS